MVINKNISFLDLKNKKLTQIPSEVFALKNLRKLDLRNNRLKSIPQEIAKLKRLEVLDISFNNIEVLHAGIFNLDKLHTLIINNNKLRLLPRQVERLKKLRILSLSNNGIVDIPEEISGLESLVELNISNNKFEHFPKSILELTSLKSLWLNNNAFINFPSEGILEKLTNLEKLYCFGVTKVVGTEYNSHFIKLTKIRGNSISVLKKTSRKRQVSKTTKKMKKDNIISKTKIFISYSHRDDEWRQKVQTYLKVLKYENDNFEVWDDTKIKAGEKWKVEIEKALKSCRIAILLISMDFLASDFIRSDELPDLLRKAEEDDTVILPFIVRPSRFTKDENLSSFQAVNEPSKPLSKLNHAEQEDSLLKLLDTIETYL